MKKQQMQEACENSFRQRFIHEGGQGNPPIPPSVMQARARSVNAQSGKQRVKFNRVNNIIVTNENRSVTAQGGQQVRFNSINQQPYHTIEGMMPYSITPTTIQPGVTPTQMMVNAGGGSQRDYMQAVLNQTLCGGVPLTIDPNNYHQQRFNNFNTTTTTPLNHQRRVVKHNKGAFSMINQQRANFNQSNSKIVATEQFLNQPLGNFKQQNPMYANMINPQGLGLHSYNLSNSSAIENYLNSSAPIAPSRYSSSRVQQQTPKTGVYLYNPFTNYKQLYNGPNTGSLASQSSSRISHSKMKNQLNNTISHIRSFSTYSKQSGRRANQTTQQQTINAIPDSEMLESEEFFEQGKVLLGDKKYKEAIKAFTKSFSLNKQNFDALFYRGVAQLDNDLPEKAISDFNELIESCPDYRKTVYIVLSIAYRRINDYTGALRTLSKAIVKYPRYIEAYIARGQIYIFQKKWDKALSDFLLVISVAPENGLGYLGQGDSLKGIGNYNGALLSYSRAVEIDQTCTSQGLMKRGILNLQMKQNEKALEDFNRLCELAERESESLLQNTVDPINPLMSSLQDMNNIQSNSQNQAAIAVSKSYFYKAKALKKLNNCNDAILYFEQVIRMCNDQFLQSSALYEIAKIKIQQKDFYEAFYNLQRATHYKLKQKKLINYKVFTEGVIFLMKRKTKTGVKLLTTLIDKISQSSQLTQSDYITPLVYMYRAYGHFVQDDFDKALKDYLKSNQLKKLNTSAHFNMIMCQGLKALEKKEYENAISFFTKAGTKLPGNRDPYFMRAVSIVYYALHKPIKPLTKNKMLRDAKRDLNRALKHSPKDYQVMYFRGTLNFALHYFYDAITDFETVIEKSEETNAKYYLARGRCYACLSMFKEAITDLSIAINLNKDLIDAFLNRGKCAYLIGDTGLAFMDFQKLIVLEPKNPMVHIYAGNLLMTTGSYEDATKAFTNADNIHKSPLALYQRSRCHVALNNMQEALKDLNKVIESSPNDKVAIADKDCLTALKLATVGFNNGSIGNAVQANTAAPLGQTQQNGFLPPPPLDKQVFEKAIVILTKLISYEKNEHLSKINHDSSLLYQHSQVIPSAVRTKADKIKAIRRRREQDRQMKASGIADNALRKNDLRFRVQQQQQQQEGEGNEEEEDDDYDDISEGEANDIDKLNKQIEEASQDIKSMQNQDEESKISKDVENEEETNYYKENIFNREDYYLYRAVMYFYAGDTERAMQDYEQSSSIMHAQKVLYPRNQFPDQDDNLEGAAAMSQHSSQTDLSDVGLCSLNIHEFSFNTVLCLLQMKDYKKALTKLDYMFDTMPKKYSSQLWLIRGLVNQQVNGHQHLAKKDFKRAYKYDNENTVRYLDRRQNIQLSVFPQQQRLCNGMTWVKFTFPGYSAAIYMKPSFSFPFIKPPNMIPCVDNSVLEQFTVKALPLKPEAPWIKRCSFGIKFTDEIYFTDDDREATPDEEKEYKKRKQQQQQRAARAAATFTRSLSERVALRTNIFQPQQPQAQHPLAAPAHPHDDHHLYDEDDDLDLDDAQRLMAEANLAIRGAQQFEEDLLMLGKDDDDDIDDDIEIAHAAQMMSNNERVRQNGRKVNKRQMYDEEDEDEEEEGEEELKRALEIAKAGAQRLAKRK